MFWIYTSIIIALLFQVTPVTGYAQNPASAKGRILNAETGEPLANAHVFLSGTKIGTATGDQGQYFIRRIPAGGHRLVVSIIGYERKTLDIIIGPNELQTIDFRLKPVVYEMPEIFVGNLDRKWRKHLRRFKNLFIGDSESADSVTILNPEVLRFERRWWGRLTAEALAPIQIENRALGYHITYHLDEFRHTGTQTRWDGEPLFAELVPADSAQAAYWKQNRQKAFYGSLQHFLLALLQNRVKEEGFIIHNVVQDVHGFSRRNRFPTSAKRLLRKSNISYLNHISFFGRLEIIYTRDKEGWRYVRWTRDPQRNPENSQTSYLELNERPITVDADGIIIEPYGATQFGYFAFQRIADAIPREFRPEGYQESLKLQAGS